MKSLLLILILFFTSCSTYRHLPKEAFKESFENNASDTLEKTLFDMRSLMNGKKLDCERIQELINSENPLSPILFSYQYESCNLEISRLKVFLDDDYKLLPEWAQKNNLYRLMNIVKEREFLFKIYSIYFKYVNGEKNIENHLMEMKRLSSTDDEKLTVETLLNTHLPYTNKNVTRFNIFNVANSFYAKRLFNQARELYLMIINDKYFTEDEKEDAWDKLRFSYKQERNKDSYLEITEKYYGYLLSIHDRTRIIKYGVILSRIYWTRDNYKKALSILDQIYKMDLNVYEKENIYYYYAGIYENIGKSHIAIEYYKKAYELSLTNSGLYDEVKWRIAWYYYKKGKYKEAIKWFSPKESLESKNWKILFWIAQSYTKLEERDLAKKWFRKVSNGDPYGFYGQFSSIYLEEELPLIKIETQKQVVRTKYKGFDWAVYLENHQLAKDIVNYSIKEKGEKLLEFYIYARDYKNSILYFYTLAKRTRDKIIEKGGMNYIFPRAYLDEFKKYNISSIVPTEFLLSIARQESAFDKDARSPADAFGILQMIPSQASRLSQKYNIPYRDFYDLYNLEIMIPLASKLQEELFIEFDGNYINTIASYNAGEAVVKKWRKNIPLNGFEFIEEIPYKETRKYVKLVLRNYLIYKRMNDKDYSLDSELIY